MKIQKTLQTFVLLIAVLSFSCKKQSDSIIAKADKPEKASIAQINSIKEWLQIKREIYNDPSNDTIYSKINWEISQKIDFRDSLILITVPINTSITFSIVASILQNSTNQTQSELLITMNKNEKVIQGGIAQLTPEMSTDISENKVGIIKNIFDEKVTNYDGFFTMLDINKQFQFQIHLKDSKKLSESILQSDIDKKVSVSGNNGVVKMKVNNNSVISNGQQTCINWYLVTTYADGSQYWLFLYQTCTDNCEQTAINPKGEITVQKHGGCRGGGGSGGTSPLVKDITVNLNKPCFVATWGQLMSKGFADGLNSILKQTFGLTTQFNITLGEKQVIYGPNGEEWSGEAIPHTNNWGGLDIEVNLSLSSMANASQEYIATVIYHEILHGYFDANFGPGMLGSAQHDEMSNKYLDAMTTAITTAFPNTTTNVSQLVWTGLQYTAKWDKLSPIEQGNISRLSYNNRIGMEGMFCQ